MNHSRKLATLLGGLSLLTVAAFAQDKDPARTGSTGPAIPPASQSASKSSPSIDSRNSASDTGLSAGAAQFKILDSDNDGRISRTEYTASVPKVEGSANGTVTADAKSTKTEKKHWWSRKDKDTTDATATTDSNLSSSGNTVELFSQLDTNSDGYLSQAELSATRAHNVQQ